MSHGRRVELFVRSLGTEGSNPLVTSVLDRLDTLVTTDAITDYEVHIVGRSIRPEIATETVPGRFICERVVAFREWARRSGVTLEPYLETRHVHSELADEDYRTIVFPTAVLAELEDGRPRAVAPCATGDRTYGVMDLLDALGADGERGYPRGEPDEPSTECGSPRDATLEAALGRDPAGRR